MLCLVTQSCPTLCDPWTVGSPVGSSIHRDSPGKNTGMGCHVLLHGIFPTQESNPGFPHCRRILYHLRHQGSPMGNYIPITVMSKGDLEHRHQQNQIPYTDSLRLVLPQDREIENQPGYCCSPLHSLPSSLCPPPNLAHQNIGKRTVLIVHTSFP